MNISTTTTIGVLFLCCISLPLCAQQNFEVELGAFDRQVSLNYFSGIADIVYYKDANDIHRYRIKNLKSEQDAKEQVALAKSKGLRARIIDVDAEMEALAKCQEQIDHLFFEFDQSNLNKNAKKQLDELAKVLRQNKEYVAVLAGHTDNKGGNDYNEWLARQRVESAKSYLLTKNIASSQISIQAFGESWPVAKNDLNNSIDLPQGRKFNRRVEILLINTSSGSSTISNLVKDIVVPSELKY